MPFRIMLPLLDLQSEARGSTSFLRALSPHWNANPDALLDLGKCGFLSALTDRLYWPPSRLSGEAGEPQLDWTGRLFLPIFASSSAAGVWLNSSVWTIFPGPTTRYRCFIKLSLTANDCQDIFVHIFCPVAICRQCPTGL